MRSKSSEETGKNICIQQVAGDRKGLAASDAAPKAELALKQGSQHAPAFLQRLIAKQTSHPASWTDSDSGEDHRDDAEDDSAGEAHPMRPQPQTRQDASAVAALQSQKPGKVTSPRSAVKASAARAAGCDKVGRPARPGSATGASATVADPSDDSGRVLYPKSAAGASSSRTGTQAEAAAPSAALQPAEAQRSDSSQRQKGSAARKPAVLSGSQESNGSRKRTAERHTAVVSLMSACNLSL